MSFFNTLYTRFTGHVLYNCVSTELIVTSYNSCRVINLTLSASVSDFTRAGIVTVTTPWVMIRLHCFYCWRRHKQNWNYRCVLSLMLYRWTAKHKWIKERMSVVVSGCARKTMKSRSVKCSGNRNALWFPFIVLYCGFKSVTSIPIRMKSRKVYFIYFCYSVVNCF